MKLKNIIALAALTLPLSAAAQTITFDTEDYASLGVYDTWEESPFRTGKLTGNVAVIDNHLNQVDEQLGTAPNPSSKILAVQRSRFGSNTFGALVKLNETFELTPTTKYLHLMVNRPYAGRVMVVGLGKRRDRAGQSPMTEQFWAMTMSNIPANRWQDIVLPIKGNGGIDINSLVIIPDCESPHAYTADEMCYIDNIEINDDSQVRFSYEFYPTYFDKNANHTRNDRWTNSVAITAASAGTQTVTPPTNPKRAYSDMTSKVFLLKPGENVTTTFRYSGAWMHGYVYLDKNNNGKFDVTINDNGTLPTESDLMTYSYYKGKNSLGNTLAESANLLNPPAFTIPTDMPEGFYRMRFKVDWDHIDAGGNPGPNNSLIGNGGNIIDVMVNIHGDNCTVEQANRNGDVVAADGSALSGYKTPFGQPFTIKMKPEQGFEYAGIIVKHGYNLSGDSIVNDNVQWRKQRFPRRLFDETNHTFTIPAECMDGIVEIEGLFIENGTYVPEKEPERYETTLIKNGEFVDTTAWYTMQIGQSGYVLTNPGTATYMSLSLTEFDIENDAHLWCFIGNENVGYQIYNKQAGPTKVLAAPKQMLGTTGGSSYVVLKDADAVPSDYCATWRFLDSSDLGSTGPAYAYMYEDGNQAAAVNNRDGRLAFWSTGKDKGSTLRIFFAKKGQPTGIQGVVSKSEEKIYDLSGRRVTNPEKGVYVVGPQKRYIK